MVAFGGSAAAASRFGLAKAEDGVHWDYHSHGGPEAWDELTEPGSGVLAYPDCGSDRQSPVDVPRRAPVSTGLMLDYRPSGLTVLNNGHTIQVAYDAGSKMTAAGKAYRLLQFHFHAPSEHLLNGRPAALEAHFVHQAEGGELAVLGVLMVEGAAHPAFQRVLDVMPEHEGAVSTSGDIDAAGFLPGDLAYYAYEGSLTTPPCSEGVRWHLLREPISVSAEQADAFRRLMFLNPEGRFAGNARPVQPLNGRFDTGPALEGTGRVTPPSTGSAGLVLR